VITASHKPLDRINRILRIRDRLAFCNLPDEPFARLRESDYRGRRPPSFFIGNDLGLPAFHDGYAGIRGPQVNPYNLGHEPCLLNLISPLSTMTSSNNCFIISQMIWLE